MRKRIPPDNSSLLRSYVKQVIKEEEVATDALGNAYYGGGYGSGGLGGETSGGLLYKAFVKPFTDVIGVAAGKTKEIARSAVTVIQVAFETIMTTLIPFLEDSYDEIFAQRDSDIERIRSEYSSYYNASDEALGTGDAKALAFIAFPTIALGTAFVEKAPTAAKNILSIATGGVSDKYLSDSVIKSRNLVEEKEDKKQSKLVDKIQNKEFINAVLKNSDVMLPASEEAKNLYRETLKNAFEQAKSVCSAKSIDEIEKITGSKLTDSKQVKEFKGLKGVEKQRSEKLMMDAIKKSMKKFYISRLEKEVKPVEELFGKDYPFVSDYRKTINAIKSL